MKRATYAVVCLLIGGLVGGLIAGPQLHDIIWKGATNSLVAAQQPAGNKPAPLVVPQEKSSYREVVSTILPAVVSIEARTKQVAKAKTPLEKPQIPDFPKDFGPIPEEFRKFFDDLPEDAFKFEIPMPEAVPRHGFGSGFIVDPEGIVMTNYHVVAGAETVTVTLEDGREFTATDIKSDPKTDLAILYIDAGKPLPYLEFGDSKAMEIGDRVLAVGAPFGLSGTVTHGIVSSKQRHFNPHKYQDFVQTDAAINPGNSGGPLVNLQGKVIGVNTLIKTRNGSFQGVGMSIASDLAKHVLHQLREYGEVRRGYLGVQIKDLKPEVAQRLGLKNKKGVLVTRVLENSPAANAGLKAGDIIVALNGRPLADSWSLVHQVTRLPINKSTSISVIRNGSPKKMQVTIAKQPEDFAVAQATPEESEPEQPNGVHLDDLGFVIADLTPALAKEFGYEDAGAAGALVTDVTPGSLAAIAGLREGALILEVDKQAVRSAAEAEQAIGNADLARGILLQVRTPRAGIAYYLLRRAGA